MSGLLIHRTTKLLAAALAATACTCARADFFVVVNANNPAMTMSQKQVLDLFMGRTRSFAGRGPALPLDLPRDSAERAGFYLALAGMSQAQVNSYWSRLMFSGQNMPPVPVPDEAVMVSMVRGNASAIGYLRNTPSDPALRVVLVLKAPD